ncbi:response regulator [Levilinea saccharolytica]|uniref:LuxR family transcriptional regulator n=1 Tax=Levilinea saccharolytica TaxID=229921 RepID=A0A0P6YHT6_9CHLR|nr:response regulator transcription factor [Levilinea saccharolytica]KPL91801.1 LuxR family transcriptional regulator [Levilinea saccharolytica]GAP17614.1 two component transcriptional regulator, LuxR family [Levilinea saccharolytica]
MSDIIRIMLVDDHAVVRSGLSAFLSVNPDLELVGEAENGEQAVVRAGLLKPDVILMDLMMPVMDGVAATAAIKKQYPHIQVIALTSFQEDELVQNALRVGAIGYLMKNVSARELAAAIRAAKEGKVTLSPEATQALVHFSQQPQEAEILTEREREVLKLMVEGLNNAEIAERLVVSLSTIKYHISNILMKLGVDNRVAAVTTAMNKKLV